MPTRLSGAKRHQYKLAKPKTDEPAAPKSRAERKRERRQRAGKGVKYVLVAIGIAAMVLSVSAVACVGIFGTSDDDEVDYYLTGGVAATVNGVNITEDTITEQIMSTRSSLGYDDDEDWAQYLVDNDETPESYRESIIESYVEQYLVAEAISEYGITVSDEEIDEEWEEVVSGYDSEEAFIELLEMLGMTEDDYRSSIESSLETEKLYEEVAPATEPTDDEIVEYMNTYLSSYNNSRRSSHILFSVDDDADDETIAEIYAEAESVLEQINSGEITFEEAVAEYSDDTSSVDDDGDVGWDKLTTFVDAYQDALSELSVGEISGIVESDYGYHIILCTDLFSVDDSVSSIDEIPEEMQEYISSTLESVNQRTAYNEWLEEYVAAADVVINDMPEDVPYNVDLDIVESSSDDADDDDDTEESADGSDDESTDDDTSEDDTSSE